MVRLAPSAVIALALAPLAGIAQADCPGQTQMEMNSCAARDYQQADAALNLLWPKAKAVMDGMGAGDDLLDAQRKWIAFRDAACDAEAAVFEGGSIQPLIAYSCLTRLTTRRSQDLQTLLTN